MISERRRIGTAVAFSTLALIVALGLHPVASVRIVGAYALALAAIAAAALVRAVARGLDDRTPSPFEYELLRRPEPPTRPPELVRIERDLSLGMASAGHLHLRLLPLLREIAQARLGIDLERQPAVARSRLDDEAWELLRPGRPAPDDRTAPSPSLRRTRAIVDALERT